MQFLYGEDGLDVGSSQYLKSKNLDFLRVNSHITLNSESMNKIRKIGYLGPQKTIHKAKKEVCEIFWLMASGELQSANIQLKYLRLNNGRLSTVKV